MSTLIPAEVEAEPAHDEAEVRRARASPGLNQFRCNPFRVLRLPAAATSKQAVWRAEKALSLTRAGMPLPGVELIPWLPPADELDIQQAAQAMEEPLSRLCDQLLWFDHEADPMGEELRRALQGDDGEAILGLIEARDPAPLADPDAAAVSGDIAAVARRIHDANFRLLLAFSMLHEVGPGASTGLESEQAMRWKMPGEWSERSGLPCIEDAHARFAPDPDGSASACVRLLRGALARWAGIFGDQRWGDYLRYQIARLDDELVSGEEVEALTNAVAMRIVDVVAGEVKLVTISGRLDRTVELVRAAAQSGIAPGVWQKAFRGLRYVFRAELDEIAGMMSGGAQVSLEDMQIHVARLDALGSRWRELDQAGLLGLAPLIDESAMHAFELLCSIHGSAPLPERVAQCGRVLNILATVSRVARSASLKNRVEAFREAVGHTRNALCHFCLRREPSRYPVVVEGRIVRGRPDLDRGITVSWIRRGFVPRCERCADLHDFEHYCVGVQLAALLLWWVAAVAVFWADLSPLLVAVALPVSIVVILLLVNAGGTVIPPGEKEPWNVFGTEAYEAIEAEASITVHNEKMALTNLSRR